MVALSTRPAGAGSVSVVDVQFEYSTHSPALHLPTDVTLSADGRHVFVSDTDNRRIV